MQRSSGNSKPRLLSTRHLKAKILGFWRKLFARALIEIPGIGMLTGPSAVTIAMVLIFVGYHTASYGGPDGLLTFRVPSRLGWLVYAGGVLAVIGALLADRIDRRE